MTGEIPPSLDSLTSLVNLYLHENKLTGEIPASLGNFADITQLFLWGNQLTGKSRLRWATSLPCGNCRLAETS